MFAFGNDYHLESNFNYKGFNCYIGFLCEGYRTAYIEFDTTNLKIRPEKLEERLYTQDITLSAKSNIENHYILGIDFNHINNLFDLKSLEKYFPDKYLELKDRCIERNRDRSNLYPNAFIGTEFDAESSLKAIVDEILYTGLFNNE